MKTLPVNEQGEISIINGVPEGLVHINVMRVGPTCIAKNIQYGKALVGYRYIDGKDRPVYEGVVVFSEDKETLLKALEDRKPGQLRRVKNWENKQKQIAAEIRKRFPGMPPEEEHRIVKHAWEKQSGRVGRQLTVEKAILPAVIAHIRHTYTLYEVLIKDYKYSISASSSVDCTKYAKDKARESVSGLVFEILYKWQTEGDFNLPEIIYMNLSYNPRSMNERQIFSRFKLHRKRAVRAALNVLVNEGRLLYDATHGTYSIPACKFSSSNCLPLNTAI